MQNAVGVALSFDTHAVRMVIAKGNPQKIAMMDLLVVDRPTNQEILFHEEYSHYFSLQLKKIIVEHELSNVPFVITLSHQWIKMKKITLPKIKDQSLIDKEIKLYLKRRLSEEHLFGFDYSISHELSTTHVILLTINYGCYEWLLSLKKSTQLRLQLILNHTLALSHFIKFYLKKNKIYHQNQLVFFQIDQYLQVFFYHETILIFDLQVFLNDNNQLKKLNIFLAELQIKYKNIRLQNLLTDCSILKTRLSDLNFLTDEDDSFLKFFHEIKNLNAYANDFLPAIGMALSQL